MALVNRDPFARTELHRELVVTKWTCDWCGQKRYYGGKKTDKLFEFHTESDGGRKSHHPDCFAARGVFVRIIAKEKEHVGH